MRHLIVFTVPQRSFTHTLVLHKVVCFLFFLHTWTLVYTLSMWLVSGHPGKYRSYLQLKSICMTFGHLRCMAPSTPRYVHVARGFVRVYISVHSVYSMATVMYIAGLCYRETNVDCGFATGTLHIYVCFYRVSCRDGYASVIIMHCNVLAKMHRVFRYAPFSM